MGKRIQLSLNYFNILILVFLLITLIKVKKSFFDKAIHPAVG